MKEINNILLKKDYTIQDALEIIDTGKMKIALVVDDDEKLIGTVTDGDIRRGLLNKCSLKDSVEKIIFKSPTVCKMDDSKEKILNLAIKRKLYQIPIVDDDNKLIGIEEIDELLKEKTNTNKVVLMVGGLGTRLMPLTEKIPKPMLKVGNRPILETIINGFKKYGYINFILCVRYKSDIIENYFEDGSKFGVNIEYVFENERMGTAGALSLLKNKIDEPFFVMNGDLLTNVNFEHMMHYHMINDSVGTMAVRDYEYQVPYGVVNLNNDKIISIDEKPIKTYFVSAGIYILNKDVLSLIPEKQFFDMPSLFELMIEKRMNCVSFYIREYWLDIGQIEDFKRAQNEFINIYKEE